MAKGLVYILTNPCLDGWVKIGMTERIDIDGRLRELNAPANMPLSFRCFATYEVDNPKCVEKHIHSLIDRIDYELHAREQLDNGKVREREFFRISAETAFGIFSDVAKLRNDFESLKRIAPTQEQALEEEYVESSKKRTNNTFKKLGLAIGDEIEFSYDRTIAAKVADEKNQVEYLGERYSVSELALKLLVEKRGWSKNASVNGWRYFLKNERPLSDLRDNMEIQVTDMGAD